MSRKNLKDNGANPLTANLSAGTYKITNLGNASSAGDAVSKGYLETALGTYVLEADLTTTLADYVLDSALTTTLADYVLDSALTTTLADYVLIADKGEMPTATVDPGTPVAGQCYFNTGDNHFYGYNGTVWLQLDNAV